MKKNKKVLIIVAIVIIVLLVIGIFCYSKLDTTKPYVIANKIKILDVNKKYSVPVEFYTKDTDGNLMDVSEITLDKSELTFKFYDYEVSKPDKDGYSVYSFKVEAVAPLTYTFDINNYKKEFRYTLYFYQPAVFDYYTGELCKEKDVSINNSVNYYSGTDKYEGEYAFTTITWKNKSYKIGVRMETSFKWSGSELVSEENGILHKKDSATLSINAFVYAPADYDGLMISLRNIGTSKKDYIKSFEKSQKYKKLLNEYNETGEKPEELKKIEESADKVYKLLEGADGKSLDKKNFYVFRMSDIKPKENKKD